MRLHIVSDLHLNSQQQASPLPQCADVLVIAGDAQEGASSVQALVSVAQRYLDAGLPVLYVLGNHEFLGGVFRENLRKMHRMCRKAGITLLHNRAVTVGGVEFFGATLWTGYRLPGMSDLRANMRQAQHFMPEHQMAWTDVRGKTLLSPAYLLRAHEKSVRILEAFLAKPSAAKRCIVTHHSPTIRGIAPRFRPMLTTAAFTANMEPMMARYRPNLWVFGHTHFPLDTVILRTRVVTNPCGYAGELPRYNAAYVVEL